MPKIIDNRNCTIVFLALDFVGIIIFFLAVGHRTPPQSFQNFVEINVFRIRVISELFSSPITASVGVEEPVAVKDAPLRYIPGGRQTCSNAFGFRLMEPSFV